MRKNTCAYSWDMHTSQPIAPQTHVNSLAAVCTHIFFLKIPFIMYNTGEGIHLLSDMHLLRCVWIIQWALPLPLCVDWSTLCPFGLIICVCSSVGHISKLSPSLPLPNILHFLNISVFLHPFLLFSPFLTPVPSLTYVLLGTSQYMCVCKCKRFNNFILLKKEWKWQDITLNSSSSL